MLKIFSILFILIFTIAVALSIFKRKKSLPCPSWLTSVLNNPYTEFFAGSSILIDRIGLKPGMRILDIGCGPGRLTIPFAKLVGQNGEVVALDIQEKMLQKLKKHMKESGLTNIRIIRGGADQDKIQEQNGFDRAILVTVLGEIPDKKKALEETFKSLKPNGILSITEVLPDPDYQRQSIVLGLANATGFILEKKYENILSFTMNFIKPSIV